MRTSSALLLLLASCGPAAVSSPPGTYDKISTLVLRDVQGLFGGQDAWIRSDGSMVVRTVRPPKPGESGLQESRWTGTVAVEELKALLAKHDPFAMQIPERPGVPDEARPTLVLRLSTGSTVKVAKWDGQKHADFDALYAWLLGKVTASTKTRPAFSGALDWDWRPEGYQD